MFHGFHPWPAFPSSRSRRGCHAMYQEKDDVDCSMAGCRIYEAQNPSLQKHHRKSHKPSCGSPLVFPYILSSYSFADSMCDISSSPCYGLEILETALNLCWLS